MAPSNKPFVYFDLDKPDRTAAVFIQHELPLRSNLTLQWGARLDESANSRRSASPRVALVYHQSKRSTWKLPYGRAFRNPNSYECYFNDGLSQVANLGLRPETANTFKAVISSADHRHDSECSEGGS